jgi:6,7-dimethyl-8-ribityllumazine synthase
MPKEIEGKLTAEGRRFGLVVGRFNHFITDQLVAGAIDGLTRHGADADDITIVRVPGSFELPAAASRLAKSGKVDAVIGISALIRGATTHYDHIAAEVTKGLATLSMHGDVPVIYGVVTAETIEQAVERAGTKAGNRGFQAAMAAIEMVNLYQQI